MIQQDCHARLSCAVDSVSFGICVGCDIVQSDHAPEAGVAQGIFHGILVRHHRNQEEVEVGLDEEVERKRHEEEDTQEQVRMSMTMDGTKTHRRDLSQCDV